MISVHKLKFNKPKFNKIMYEIYNSDPYNANALTILIKISHKNTFKVYLSVNRYISDSIKRYGCTSNSMSFILLPANKPTKKP